VFCVLFVTSANPRSAHKRLPGNAITGHKAVLGDLAASLLGLVQASIRDEQNEIAPRSPRKRHIEDRTSSRVWSFPVRGAEKLQSIGRRIEQAAAHDRVGILAAR